MQYYCKGIQVWMEFGMEHKFSVPISKVKLMVSMEKTLL